MSGIAEARKNLPSLSALDDGEFVDALHQMYYPGMDKAALSAKLGYTPPAPPAQQAGLIRSAGDVGIKLAQGVVDVGSSIVGLGSLATGGLIGKGARAIGYDPKRLNEIMGQGLSDSQNASDAKVAAANGFTDTVVTSLQNPRSILGSVAESAPGMLAGMGVTSAVARGIATKAALATGEGAAASAAALAAGQTAKVASTAAMATEAGAKAASAAIEKAGTKLIGIGAATEGAQSTGQIADNAQADGRAYADYALPALAAGVGTAAIGLGAGKLMGDSATSLATGARSAGVRGGMAARVGKEALSEGVLEEMPQSAQEQYWTNIAMGEADRMKGVANAAGSGLVTGAAMGGGMGALQKGNAAPAVLPVTLPTPLPNTGPLSQAANAGQQAVADAAAAAAAAAGSAQAEKTVQPLPLDVIDARMDELLAIGRGTPARRAEDQNGIMVTIPSTPGRKYTPAEEAEFKALASTREARTSIPADQREEYSKLLAEEAEEHTRRLQEAQDKATYLLPSSPNELVDAVPERKAPAPSPGATNTAAVDAAIAAGMRLKTLNGTVLHKPGSNKIFKLSTEQKAHYQAAIELHDAEQAREQAQRLESETAAKERQVMDETNAVVEKERAARAEQNRAALRAQVLNDTGIPAGNKAAAFKAALKRDGYVNTALTQADYDDIKAAISGIVQPVENAANGDVVAEIAPNMQGNAVSVPQNDDLFSPTEQSVPPSISEVATPPAAAATLQQEAETTTTDDAMLGQATEFVRTSGSASISKLQRHLRVGYNRAARLLETMEAGGLVSAMESNGNRTVIASASALDAAAHAAATSPLNDVAAPTDAQKEAGNYKKAHVRLHGLDISIENPVASKRSGVDKTGMPWETQMQHHYGYIKGTVGMDKDHIDTFIGPNQQSTKVFVVDQIDPASGKPDEHKVMLGFDSHEQASTAYKSNYAPEWTGGKSMTETTMEEFKAWLASGKTHKPFAKPAKAAPAAKTTTPPPAAAPQLTAQQLNRMTVKDMSDEQLHRAREVFAGGPREMKVASEMAKRKLAMPAAVAPLDLAPAVSAPAATDSTAAQASPPAAPVRTPLQVLAEKAKAGAARRNAADSVPQPNAAPPLPIVEPHGAGNKLFTADRAEKARALLKSKLGTTYGGIDPELLMAGIELAGFHIEAGARTFAAYAKAMIADIGEGVRPYLRSYYEGVRHYPGLDTKGMSTPAEIDALEQAGTTLAKPVTINDTETTPAAAATKEQDHDSTPAASAPAIDSPVAEGQRPAGSDAVTRGAGRPGDRVGRNDAGSVREPRGRDQGQDDARQDLGHERGADSVSDRSPDAVERSGQRVSADFRPSPGGLTREGSWLDTAKRNIDLIELALKVENENRPATAAEQAQLARYVGFGASAIRNKLFPIPPAYSKQQDPGRLIWPSLIHEPSWRSLAERMEALPAAWQRSVLQSSQYAHYTSEGIIRSTWNGLQRLGFTGGKVFEPGMGIGSFSMLMPEEVRNTSRYTGVEFDGPTALIARLLSPEQNMLHDDFIKRKFPKDYFDVAIGNPPFSQTQIFADPDYEKHGFMLHDFFFAKSIDRVRPGGLLAFVTSKGTMDKQTDKARKYLATRADLVGAIRLPSTAFEDNAGTSVVTDVIFLRKRQEGETPAGQAWAKVATVDTKDGPVVVNEYFANNPDMVLGQNRISGNVDDSGRRINSNGRGGEQYTVVSYDSTPAELDAKFAVAVERLPANVYSVLAQSTASVQRETAKVDFDPSVKREGVVYLATDGTIMRVENGVGQSLDTGMKMTAADKAWFTGYVGLRDLVQEARLAQASDGKWEAGLKKLNQAYDAFRAEHGPINDFRVQVRTSTDEDGKLVETESRIFKNRRRFREDYDSAILTQLETINEAGEIVKSPFLLGRTIGKPMTRDVKTIGDALAVSLDETGRLDLDDIGRRIGLSHEDTLEALGNQVYRTPAGDWQLADEYLSGDVVSKLEEAEQAARLDDRLARNVEALKAAQPEKLGPSQISAKLGASWIPVAHVNAFAAEIDAGAVAFDPQTETWQVDGGNLRSQRRAGAEYGTAARSASELLESALNSRSIKITSKIEGKTVTDQEATTAANEMLKKIKDKFKGWVWTDSDRASDLVELYNSRYNNIAPRRFDGSHLTLPGVSMRYNLHPHQKRAIWRMVQTGDTYLAHAVGSGKTIEMIAGGMEQKRLGLIKKPMYVVPNHMLEQFANEFMELYPLANIMVADDENFSAERRKAFIASATLNNPDAVIITHDAFQRIGVKEESVAPIRDAILADLEIELSETATDNGARVRRSQLEQQIEAVTQRFDRIISAGGKDSTLKFEDIGVDFVFADEAHVFRKLDFHTSQQIKGIDPNGSKRALDMYVKTRWLQQQRPGRAMVFASGTPVTNTMGELYTIMRFFAPEEMDRAGIATFDAWARLFGEVAPALEPNAAGKYELVERFAKFDNVPELMSRVRQFMDVLTSEHLGALVKRPDLIGGKPNLNIVAPSSALDTYMKTVLGPRIEKSKRWKPSKEEPNNPDPIVSIITDGRFAAIDPRFFGGALAEEGSIITAMGDKVVASYHAGKDNVYQDRNGKDEPTKGSTQVVFYNMGFGEQSQKNRGFNSRAAFTKRLTDGGIPREQIAWFDDANSDAKKEAVFKDMRSGKLRVLIGSAKKMGTGVNVQKRLAVLHYQDPPWFPADVEQPHGRIIRQGNQNAEVAIEWYTTKGTYQSTMWQMVGRKQRFIDQAFSGDKTLRSMDDMGEASLFEQAAAVASGDPRAIQLAGLKQEVERFERLQAAHASEQINVRSALRSAEWQVETARKRINSYGAAFQVIGQRLYTFREAKVGNAQFDKVGEFGQAVKEAFNQVAAESIMGPAVREQQIGTLGEGLSLTVDAETINKKQTGEFSLYVNVGDLPLTVATTTAMGENVDAVGLGRRIINQINSISQDLSRAKGELASGETDLVRLRKKNGAPFEYQQEMAEKYGDLKRLEEELRLEGMAPAAVPIVINEDGATTEEASAAAAVSETTADYFRDTSSTFLSELPNIEAQQEPGELAPMTLSGPEMGQALKDVGTLNRILEHNGLDGVRALRTAPNENYALARQIGAALGIKVHYVTRSHEFHGVAAQGIAYLSEGMPHPELAIAGHEMLHALEQQSPELGSKMRVQVRAYLRAGVIQQRMVEERTLSEQRGEGELLADINGAMWLDPVFWRDMAKADRNLFRRAAYMFMQVAAKAIKGLKGGRFDAGKFVTDVDAVRAILVATWAEHAQGLDSAATADTSVAFSRDAGNSDAAALDRQRSAGRQFAVAALQSGGRAAYNKLKEAGATSLTYPQWVITKTPNFKQFYGDWENAHGREQLATGILGGDGNGQDTRGNRRRGEVTANRPPSFPGQSGPVRKVRGATQGEVGGIPAQVEPVIYYHGSRADITAFELHHPDRKDNGWLGRGVYVTSDPDEAHDYASLKFRGDEKPNITPLFVAVRNPYSGTQEMKDRFSKASRADIDRWTAQLINAGYDGVQLNVPGFGQELVAFDPAAVKSAIGNNGAFDAGSADIRFSRAGIGEALKNAANNINAVRLPANYRIGDLFNQSGKIGWWHKTIGTMDNLAKRAPAFAKVYEAVQSFIGDVSRYAVVSADLAPRLLPKLENVADVIGKNRKKALTAADTKAIGAPIFEGTLAWARDAHGEPIMIAQLEAEAEAMTIDQKAQVLLHKRVIDEEQNKAWRSNRLDFYESIINNKFNETQLKAGIVWSDAELRNMFHLNDDQVGLYREFRAALDKSLTNLTISEMVKLGGKDASGMLEQAVAAPDLASAGELLRDHFVALAKLHPEKIDMHLDTAKQIMDLADKGQDLMDRGYAPLSRFGKHTVYTQKDGEQVYFGMFETQYEASKMARDMAAEHPDAEVSQGTISEDAYKLFAGVSPETIELFGSMVGLDSQADAQSTEVYQTYLKLAKNNRSSMKRLIQRKGIAGFSEDAGRVLAGFIYSNARLTAGNAHLGKIDEAVTEIPKQQGELTDAAMQLREHIRNPEGGGSKLGGLMFAQFLGGSVASAMVNLTQPFAMTLPFLSQWGGIGKAGKRLVGAIRDAGKDTTGDAQLDAAMRWAAEEGIVAPQEVHYLQAQAQGKGGLRSGDGTRAGNTRAHLNNAMAKVSLGWGKLFAMAELANRRITFIAAYRTAVEEGMPNPERFAQQAVTQTQGMYNAGNKPKWARSTIGGLLMTFKQYSIAYLELLSRMAFAGKPGSKERAAGRRAALYMVAVLFLMGGADGLPFEQDLEDALDGILQRLGYNFSTKRKKQEFLTGMLGQGGADFALKGLSAMPGMPIDVAGRFGMGNLIPGTGLLTKKDSYTRDLGELAGPAGDFVKRVFTGTGKALGGDLLGGALDMSPAAVRNLAKGTDMLVTGAYHDTRGYTVNNTSPTEAVMKMIGFQPNSTADIQGQKGQALEMVSQNRMRSSEIAEHWAQGLANGKPDMVQEARAMRDDWNQKNPEAPIRVNLPGIIRRVRAMKQDALARTQKTAPAALKQTVRRELASVRD